MKYIERQLENWCPKGGYKSYELYEVAQASNFAMLPYPGGYLSQPAWLLSDWQHIMLREEWERLNSHLPKAPGRGAPKAKDAQESDSDE